MVSSNFLVFQQPPRYLNIFGAICIEGPKWCGKTWTSLHHSQSVTYMTETENKNLAAIDPKYIFTKERPQLIDEWQLVPSIWDSVRHECDSDQNKGKFILTGSTTLTKEESEAEVYHSGAGRIAPLKMYTMSLYESGDSTGEISITEMIEHKEIGTYTPKTITTCFSFKVPYGRATLHPFFSHFHLYQPILNSSKIYAILISLPTPKNPTFPPFSPKPLY